MNIQSFSSRIFAAVVVILAMMVAAFLFKGTGKKKREQRAQQMERMMSGNCKLDSLNLDSLIISENALFLHPIFSEDSIQTYELTGKIMTDRNNNFKIGRTSVHTMKRGKNIYINTMQVGSPCYLEFYSGDKRIFSAFNDLHFFESEFPLSYYCRANQKESRRFNESIFIRINNSNKISQIRALILYFKQNSELNALSFLYND